MNSKKQADCLRGLGASLGAALLACNASAAHADNADREARLLRNDLFRAERREMRDLQRQTRNEVATTQLILNSVP